MFLSGKVTLAFMNALHLGDFRSGSVFSSGKVTLASSRWACNHGRGRAEEMGQSEKGRMASKAASAAPKM